MGLSRSPLSCQPATPVSGTRFQAQQAELVNGAAPSSSQSGSGMLVVSTSDTSMPDVSRGPGCDAAAGHTCLQDGQPAIDRLASIPPTCR